MMCLFCVGCQGAGTHPGTHWPRGGVHPGQSASLSHGWQTQLFTFEPVNHAYTSKTRDKHPNSTHKGCRENSATNHQPTIHRKQILPFRHRAQMLFFLLNISNIHPASEAPCRQTKIYSITIRAKEWGHNSSSPATFMSNKERKHIFVWPFLPH